MKFAVPAILMALGFNSATWGQALPSAPNPEASPQGFAMKLFNQPGSNPNSGSYSGQLHFYPDDEKEKQFTIAPAPITDPANQPATHPGYNSGLSLQNEKNIGIAISIPFDAIGLPGGAGTASESANRSAAIGAGRAGH